MSEDKPSRQKLKWTKELVHIALNDGMTQEEISKVCRTQRSVVSSWKNGKNKATEQQLAELLRRYGARLNRTTAKVYLVSNSPSGLTVEMGQRHYLEPEDTRAVGSLPGVWRWQEVIGATTNVRMTDGRLPLNAQMGESQALEPHWMILRPLPC